MQWVASFRLAAPPTALRTCSAIFLLSVIFMFSCFKSDRCK